ncbi:MAG: division/cell wall cluster transcriptional repressor MraZ [Deltaproteobacteria bacterium]|nr:division/cell wall cluster transcriptional repressor MraZ [Deltaproteobacteria bacterium]
MIFGFHHCLMDEKGRLAFPAALRPALAPKLGKGKADDDDDVDRFVLTQSLFEPCLVGMTEADFQAQAEKVRALPPSHPAVSTFKRFVIAPASIVTIDKAGRVNVPRELRDHAGLERDAVWLGVIDKIELWSKGRYDELRRKHSEEDLASTREFLARHGL